ncbi:MAG: Wzt carbohydrate-binding domain-containing protein, partial [Deltaproteobacteria bacterium]|nr:Wzt carbohydrate-binding domain-containing protein [Deltaproteobacteria bacterium]
KKIVDKYTQAFYEGGPAETPVAEEERSVGVERKVPVVAPLAQGGTQPASFGTGEVIITQVMLFSRERGAVDSVYGGEKVVVYLHIESKSRICDPIVGFLVKNKLGIEIFGFNNISLQTELAPLRADEVYLVAFEFVWPLIASDNYAISIAIAEGDQEVHKMHHWIHDVITVEVLRMSKYQFGLVEVESAEMKVTLLDADLSVVVKE